MEFTSLTPEGLPQIRPYFAKEPSRLCDRTVGGTMLWRDYYKTEFFENGETLIFRIVHPQFGVCFSLPFGKRERGFSLLKRQAEAEGTLRFFPVGEEELAPISDFFGEPIRREEIRNASDYLYRAENLIALSGSAYAGQRNQISKFCRENPDWSFERITAGNAGEAALFCEDFFRTVHKNYSDTFQAEGKELPEAFAELGAFGMFGGILRGDDRIAAVALGEIRADTLYVHVEKADRAVRGAYQKMVNCFSSEFAGEGIAFINREEDDGDPGLRESKLSYHPAALLRKYLVVVEPGKNA